MYDAPTGQAGLAMAQAASAASAPDTADAPVVVAGGGPVGVRVAQELSRRGVDVVLVNAERWRPYNRVKLTPLLAGEAQLGQVYLGEDYPGPGRVTRYDGVSVVDVDRENRLVLTSTGRQIRYAKLVLALGSRAFIPAIPGAALSGVYAFRNFNDTEALIARSLTARSVVVVGGGLLGLEAARGMRRRGAEVTVVEHEARLMPRQLDGEAGAALAGRIEALGVQVLTGERIASIDGASRVEGVTFAGGRKLATDTVVVCTGVRANIQLPSAIGLAVGRGVTVDGEMRSSDPNIYAVGECAEHAGVMHGLVGPGYEQAVAAAASIAGDPVVYRGSVPATKLKVLGADVFSMGDYESISQMPGVVSRVWRDAGTGAYRRLLVRRGRLIAALGVGDWPESSKLQDEVARGQAVAPWNLWRFTRTGRLWKEDTSGVAGWPKTAIVCNCTGVTKGAIQDCLTLGACSIEDVRKATGANTVCGTCQPLVLDLLGEGEAPPEPVRWWKWLVGISLAAALIGLLVLLAPRIPIPGSFDTGKLLHDLWYDGIWKQWSGYTLLGLTAAGALLGIRRRLKLGKWLGGFNGWRLVHIGIGLAATLALVWHTGFRLGENLNLVLMASFIAMLLAGGVTGLVTGGEHEIRKRDLVGKDASPRGLPFWLHVLAFWPVPVLVAIHILTIYNF